MASLICDVAFKILNGIRPWTVLFFSFKKLKPSRRNIYTRLALVVEDFFFPLYKLCFIKMSLNFQLFIKLENDSHLIMMNGLLATLRTAGKFGVCSLSNYSRILHCHGIVFCCKKFSDKAKHMHDARKNLNNVAIKGIKLLKYQLSHPQETTLPNSARVFGSETEKSFIWMKQGNRERKSRQVNGNLLNYSGRNELQYLWVNFLTSHPKV